MDHEKRYYGDDPGKPGPKGMTGPAGYQNMMFGKYMGAVGTVGDPRGPEKIPDVEYSAERESEILIYDCQDDKIGNFKLPCGYRVEINIH